MAPKLKRDSATIRIDGPSARIVAVADTHSSPHAAMGERLAELRPDAILHAGDIGDLAVLDDLRRAAPLHAVRGNIDTRAHALPDVLTLDLE
ncbi:MAG TPA: metallophosphoesterase family protein, partial [Kofleriaceae bacterium]|nr:metallophosphoesterase family protein [Kofleriaceae bacterium]